jgi:hypothetical protein
MMLIAPRDGVRIVYDVILLRVFSKINCTAGLQRDPGGER